MSPGLTALCYLAAGVLFVLALRGLSSPVTSRQGNRFGMIGMAIAIVATLAQAGMSGAGYGLIILGIVIGGAIGAVVARRIKMTALPQLVAAFHSLVGSRRGVRGGGCAQRARKLSASAFAATFTRRVSWRCRSGWRSAPITFSGSLIAFAKLQALMKGAPITFPMQHLLNLGLAILLVLLVIGFVVSGGSQVLFWIIALLSFGLGFLIIIPIGGADMPVVVSMLNSYSGWAAAGIGFTIQNLALIITGSLVGASGAILSYIMCKGMNRSIVNVLLGGFGTDTSAAGPAGAVAGDRTVRSGAAEDAAFIMKNASKVIIVPGYGMAVAQAQHALREMADTLKKEGVEVKYAIHPVAGRMPGHMNVLLAEANVPYDEVFELEEINNEFSTADVAYVIGANDVTNPAAKTDRSSAIYGMPILDVEKAGTVLFVKRSMASGYAGVENELFFRPNTMMLFGDAKKMTEEIVQALGH